jgi:hypothetical protein
MIRLILLSSIFTLSFWLPVKARNTNSLGLDTSIHVTAEIQALASDVGTTPFWIRSLQYGAFPVQNPGAVFTANSHKNYNLKKKLDWKYGIEITGWAGKESDIMLTEAYLSGRGGRWEIWAGRRKEVYGLGDTTLSGGFYAWSGNARPMPKIQIGTCDYINFLGQWLGVNMNWSHGVFDAQGLLKGAILHQKSLYGRLGKPTSLISIFGGLNHQVSWGGDQKVKTGGPFDYYPTGLNTYFYVVTLLKDRELVAIDKISSDDDTNNQYGNHLGSIDLALKLQAFNAELLIYKQTAYETGRVFSLITADDGITGISFKRKKKGIVEGIVLEHLYTQNQGLYISAIGKFFNAKDPHYPEQENYFNNGARGGWNYQGKGIGTPLIVIDSESQQTGNPYNFAFNAVRSYYVGIMGTLPSDIRYVLRASQSYHGFIAGSGRDPYKRYVPEIPQFSSSLSLQKNVLKKISLQGQIGYDHGQRVTDTMGMSIGVKYWLF